MTGTLVSKLEGPQESDFKVIVPLILRGERSLLTILSNTRPGEGALRSLHQT